MLRELRFLGQVHERADVPSCAYRAITDCMFMLFEKYVPDFTPELRQGWQTLIDRVVNVIKLPKMNEERLIKRARQYIDQIAVEQAWEPEDKARRWAEIREVKATGTYTHTYEQLAYGAQLAIAQCLKVYRADWVE